jgi:hypothetical protein
VSIDKKLPTFWRSAIPSSSEWTWPWSWMHYITTQKILIFNILAVPCYNWPTICVKDTYYITNSWLLSRQFIFYMLHSSETLRHKRNGQNVPCVHHEGVQGSGDTAQPILNLRNKWRSVTYFTLQPLYPGGRCYGIHYMRRLWVPYTGHFRGVSKANAKV